MKCIQTYIHHQEFITILLNMLHIYFNKNSMLIPYNTTHLSKLTPTSLLLITKYLQTWQYCNYTNHRQLYMCISYKYIHSHSFITYILTTYITSSTNHQYEHIITIKFYFNIFINSTYVYIHTMHTYSNILIKFI